MENKQNENKAITVQEKNITDSVLNRVKVLEQEGNLQFPANYSYSNALKSAWLILQETVDKEKNPVLQTCSKQSIADSLLDMVIQGLSPAKRQCYFVAYGKKLTLMRSYMGTVAVAKRLHGIKSVVAECIYEDDEFAYKIDFETGEKVITKHEQKFENINPEKIKGAYAIVIRDDGQPNHTEIMNIAQIKKSWNQGTAYKSGKSTAHNDFTDQMAMKTVINRACKLFINTSDDSDLLVDSFNKTDEKAYDESQIVETTNYEVEEEIKDNGNSKPIDIEPSKEDKPQPENNPTKPEHISKNTQVQQTKLGDEPGF